MYDEKGKNFTKYVDKFYQMKEIAEKEKNDVKRNVAKLFLNSLYGKTLQKANFSTTKIVNNVFQFNAFVRDHRLTDYSFINDNKILLSGEVNNKEKQISKPCQLGAFVTSYSRRIMLTYMKAIDPTLKSSIFTYTDTDSST